MLAFAAVVIPAVLWVRLSAPPTPDVAWLLYAAGVLRDGGVLGLDVIDISPPTIFWPKFAALAVGEAFGLSPWASWVAFLTLLAVASAGLARALAKELYCGMYLAPLALAVFLLLPGRDFGQREHLALICTVPWLVAIARRLEGRPAHGAALVLAVVLAAGGFAIKPYFALVWVAGALLLLYRTRSLRALGWPEVSGVALLGTVQVVGVLLIYPAYLEHVRAFGMAYSAYLAVPVWQALFIGIGSASVMFALLARVALSGARDPGSGSSAALLAGALGFWLAAGLQHKGWPYHYLPAQGLAVIAVGVLLVESTISVVTITARIYRAAAVGVIATAFAGPSLHALLQAARVEEIDRSGQDPNYDALLPLVRKAAAEGSVLVLSTNIASSFPLAAEAGAQWAFRQPSLAMMGAAYSAQLAGVGLVTPRPLPARIAIEHRLTEQLAADFLRNRPVLVLVMRPEPSVRAWGGATRFDYLAYLQADPQFLEILSDYQPSGNIGDYSLLVRRGSSLPLSFRGRMPPDDKFPTATIWRAPIALSVDALALLVLCVTSCLAWRRWS